MAFNIIYKDGKFFEFDQTRRKIVREITDKKILSALEADKKANPEAYGKTKQNEAVVVPNTETSRPKVIQEHNKKHPTILGNPTIPKDPKPRKPIKSLPKLAQQTIETKQATPVKINVSKPQPKVVPKGPQIPRTEGSGQYSGFYQYEGKNLKQPEKVDYSTYQYSPKIQKYNFKTNDFDVPNKPVNVDLLSKEEFEKSTIPIINSPNITR